MVATPKTLRNQTATPYAADLVLCESPDGWSLHAPGSTDEAIACGDAPYLVSGPGVAGDADYEAALVVLRSWMAD